MYVSHRILNVSAWLVACAWLYKLIEAARGLARVPNLLEPEYDVAPDGNPSVMVIVPARNEAANVAACLESLVKQDYANLRVLAVDDRSTDATGAIMQACATANGARLEVLQITELPANWLGKTHAMAEAALAAMETHNPDYLLFTDADIVFRPDAIRRSLARAVATQADHFVLLPTALVKTIGEGMLLAYLQVMSLWAVRSWRVADAKAKRDAIGVGAFNLMRASAYRQVGGFEAAPMEILEDVELGRRVKRAGLRQRIATGPGMVCVHWAAGARGIVSGMTKNLYAAFQFRLVFLLAAALWLAVFCIAPACLIALPGFRLAGLVAWAAAAGLYALSARTSRISAAYALTLPVAAAVVVYSMLRSMAITIVRGGVEWRGTFYRLSELREHTKRAL
jgi:GT2 family glycosyltransferase